MTQSSLYSPFRRRISSSTEALMVPVDLTDGELVQALLFVARELVSSSSGKKMAFQWRNSRSLIRKIEIFVVLFESLNECGLVYSYTTLLCFKEIYLLLCRSKILLDCCFKSSKLWLLVQNVSISGHFNELNLEMSTLLDVLPIDELNLSEDVREHFELLKRQLKRAKLYVEKQDELLRRQFYSFLNEFENGVPDYMELFSFFVDGLEIKDNMTCKAEIEFLEEQMCNYEGDLEPSAAVLYGFVALARYSRLLLFGFEEDEIEATSKDPRLKKKSVDSQEIVPPTDFCCPVSLDLMTDPVIVSTGQTYDRSSVARWMEDGHCTCPKTGQMLTHKRLVPNRALRNLIVQWCAGKGITLDPLGSTDSSSETPAVGSCSKAVVQANRATAALLIRQLTKGSEDIKAIAAGEIRLMAKTGNKNRDYIAELGAISHLSKLLLSSNAFAQENSVTAILNLSIYEKNKIRIMEEKGCLTLIIDVLRYGHTEDARENAAAALFSLSVVHSYKKRIANTKGAIKALVHLLKKGTLRGKKDAITGLYNLSTHPENCLRMIEAGAVTALVEALEDEEISEQAAASLALIVKQPIGSEAVGREESAVARLISFLRRATPKGKENAVATLLELCRSGEAAVAERVLKAPSLVSILQTILFTGTKRARRKAASLCRAFQRHQQAALGLGYRGVRAGHDMAGNLAANRDSGHSSVTMSITVPVV